MKTYCNNCKCYVRSTHSIDSLIPPGCKHFVQWVLPDGNPHLKPIKTLCDPREVNKNNDCSAHKKISKFRMFFRNLSPDCDN